jgi:molecular chaperone DnaK (HSP70)
MSVMIPRNTTIPAEFKDVYSTAEDNQRDVCIQIAQGERPKFIDNQELGSFTLDGLPPAKANTLKIEVTFKIDANGLMEVSALDQKTGRKVGKKIEKNGGMSAEQIELRLKEAEQNAASDKAFREMREAEVDAKYMLSEAKKDENEDWFKQAPAELLAAFRENVTELTTAVTKKDVARMREYTQKVSETRLAIGEAFSNASANDNGGGEEAKATPEATPPAAKPPAAAEDGTKPAVKKPAPPAPPAA